MSKLKVGLIGYGLIGKAIHESLEGSSAEVFIFDIATMNQPNFFHTDITSHEALAATILELNKKNIKLDSIVNCSYPRTKSYGKKLEDVTIDSFNENVSIHLGGYFNVMKQFGAYFKALGKGSIVSFSSVYGINAPRFDIYEKENFTMPVEYAAIKSAVIHLNKYMASYFKGSNVRFNVLSPGGVFSNHEDSFVQSYGKYSLSSRGGMLDPQDLTGAIKFLVSDESKFVNGQNLIVDDGWTL
ncbi:MAG: SDR family oxidoreductase [Bacteriovorax sp.]|nr:SDR family oxidoreductase [Bacteriovorax sp.]